MKILFVCEGNINRSQMAGTIFKSLMPSADVRTAGVYAGHAGAMLGSISSGSVEVMKEIGFDMSQNIVTQLSPEMLADVDKVILVGPVPGGPIPEYLRDSPKLETWDVPDPGYGQISLVDARNMVAEKVKKLAEEIHNASKSESF